MTLVDPNVQKRLQQRKRPTQDQSSFDEQRKKRQARPRPQRKPQIRPDGSVSLADPNFVPEPGGGPVLGGVGVPVGAVDVDPPIRPEIVPSPQLSPAAPAPAQIRAPHPSPVRISPDGRVDIQPAPPAQPTITPAPAPVEPTTQPVQVAPAPLAAPTVAPTAQTLPQPQPVVDSTQSMGHPQPLPAQIQPTIPTLPQYDAARQFLPALLSRLAARRF